MIADVSTETLRAFGLTYTICSVLRFKLPSKIDIGPNVRQHKRARAHFIGTPQQHVLKVGVDVMETFCDYEL